MVKLLSKFPYFFIACAPLIAYEQMEEDLLAMDDEDETEQPQEMAAPTPEPKRTQKKMDLADSGAQPAPMTNCWGDFCVSAAYLYWVASLDETGYAFDQLNAFNAIKPINQSFTGNPRFSVPKGQTRQLPAIWNSGFRVGIGYLFPSCNWSINLDWTRYRNATSRGLYNPNFAPDDVPHVGMLYNLWPNEQLGVFRAQTIKARRDLSYDTLDLKLKNMLFFGRHFQIGPHAGLRGALIDHHFKVRCTANETLVTVQFPPNDFAGGVLQSYDKHRVDFTGIGFRIGADSAFRFSPHFSFYADAAYTLFIAHFNQRRVTSLTNFTLDQSYVVTHISDKWQTARMNVDTAFGFRWQDELTQNSHIHYKVEIGYECQWWEGQNEFGRFTTQDFQIYSKTGGDMMLHGFTGSLSFCF